MQYYLYFLAPLRFSIVCFMCTAAVLSVWILVMEESKAVQDSQVLLVVTDALVIVLIMFFFHGVATFLSCLISLNHFSETYLDEMKKSIMHEFFFHVLLMPKPTTSDQREANAVMTPKTNILRKAKDKIMWFLPKVSMDRRDPAAPRCTALQIHRIGSRRITLSNLTLMHAVRPAS